MIALVNYDDKKYYSYLFALMKNGDESLAVVFNTSENKFELINVYQSKYMSNQNITLLDDKTNGLIEKEEIQLTSFKATECLGYEWLLNDPELLKAIEQGKQIDKKYLDLAKKLNGAIDFDKWHEVKNKRQANKLLDLAGGFHDSYIIGINYNGNNDDIQSAKKLQLTFLLYGGKRLLVLEFGGEVTMHYTFYTLDYTYNWIFGSDIIIDKDGVYWAEFGDDYDHDVSDITEQTEYIKANELRWKIIPKLD